MVGGIGGIGDGDGDRGEGDTPGKEEECVVRDVKVRPVLGDESCDALTAGLVWSGLQHQKTASNQPRLSRALISLFTLGAVLIVFRVRKSRRGYERNETRSIVPSQGTTYLVTLRSLLLSSPHNGQL